MGETAASRIGDMRLNVLFVPYWYPPRQGQRSVSGSFVREHVLAAAEHDDVHVLAFRADEPGADRILVERYFDGSVGVLDATIPSGSRTPVGTARRRLLWLFFLMRAIAAWGRPHLIHCQDRSVFYAAPSAKMLGIPYVVSNHWTGFLRRAVAPREADGFRRLLPGASRILSSNKNADSDFRAYGIEGRVSWLPNCYDPEVFHPDPSAIRADSIVHISGFTDQKRVPDILKAFRKVHERRPAAMLQMVGDGYDRAAAEAMAAEILPACSYRFRGFLPKAEVAEILRRSKGFVFPSSAETFGCALMEAMACGCPVLTTRVGGIPAVAGEGEAVFVEVGDIGAIAQGMISMLEGATGLDTERIAAGVEKRFGRPVIGKLIHGYHLEAAGIPVPRPSPLPREDTGR
jgi:glycosyltransferase involved in cell wall biosynthesis